MLLDDHRALEKAASIIKACGGNASVTKYFWVRADEEKDDVFCYYTMDTVSGLETWPGMLYPLFKRDGGETDFIFPIPA